MSRRRQRVAIAGVCVLMLMSAHASAQDPIILVPQWNANPHGSMVLAPTSANLALGRSSAETTLHVNGGSVTTDPGTGSVIIGDTDMLHMQMDINDIRVAGSTSSTFGSLYLQRYGGPMVVHASQPLEDRVYITNDGDLGVGTANPRQYAIDRYVLDENATDLPMFAATRTYAEYSYTRNAYVRVKMRVGFPADPDERGVARDTLHSDAVLQVGGKLSAQSIVVHLDHWADDVFDDGYPLMPLDEVEGFIGREKHLPGVPSESDQKQRPTVSM